jgi:hypothetical protein
MYRKYKLCINFLFVTLLAINLLACGDDPGPGPEPRPITNRAVSGKIINLATGQAVTGAIVKIDTKSQSTDTNGDFNITNLPQDGNLTINIVKQGYVTTNKAATFDTGTTTTNIEISLLAIQHSQPLSTTQLENELIIQIPDSAAQIILPANSLVDSTGASPTSTVTVELTTIDPSSNTNAMPGDYTALGTQGEAQLIESYGALVTTFKDSNGNKLTLAQNTTATIRIPVSTRSNATPPAIIPLYYFDPARLKWIQEGEATLNSAGNYYEGEVASIAIWNADILYQSINISGCVEDLNGTKIANANVFMEGKNYNGASRTTTDQNGNFVIAAKENSVSLINALSSDKLSNTIIVENTGNDGTLTNCLILSKNVLTMRLTWGAEPKDLDTHLFGPNNYHIWFYEKGNLTETPFASLDVDRRESFGPEVLTVIKFPEPGTYRYAIHNYSNTHSITESSALITLKVNGQIHRFTPPAGETTDTNLWNVFNLEVDSDENITVTTVGTWGFRSNSTRSKATSSTDK